MMLLLLVVIATISALGYLAQETEAQRYLAVERWKPQVGFIGGYASGLLVVWLAYSVIRALLLFPFQQHGFGFLISGPLLFQSELVVMTAIIGYHVYISGGTTYKAKSVWWRCVKAGSADMGKFLALSTVIFFVAWHFLSPANTYDSYSPEPDLVPTLVRDAFPINLAEPVDMHSAYLVDVVAAIPNSFVISTFLTTIGWLLYIYFDFFRRETNRGWYYPPPTKSQYQDPNVPRGGEAN